MNRTLVLTLTALVLGSAACSDNGDNTGPSTRAVKVNTRVLFMMTPGRSG